MRPPPSARSVDFESVLSAPLVDVDLFARQDQGLGVRPDCAHRCPGLLRVPTSKLHALRLRCLPHMSTWRGGSGASAAETQERHGFNLRPKRGKSLHARRGRFTCTVSCPNKVTLVIARLVLKATVYRASSYADGAARKKDRRRCYASHIYLGTWTIMHNYRHTRSDTWTVVHDGT